MKKYLLLFAFSALVLASCSEDDEDASIVGTWEGTQLKADISVSGIPFDSETDDDFNTVLEFKEDGKLLVTDEDDDVSQEGTWAYTDGKSKVTISNAFPENDIFEPAETFTIKELSNSKLTLYLEKEIEYDQIVGNLAVTVKFDRK